MTTFAAMIADPDSSRVLLCEMKPKVELNDQYWEGTSTPYYCEWPFYPPFEVKDESSTYTRKTSLVDCTAAGSSWFHDTTNARLYVHATDDSRPGVSGELYFATVLIPISSGSTNPVVYTPSDLWSDIFYMPFLDASGVSVIQEVEDFEKGGLTLSYGSLSILNDGTAYEWERDYIWDYADFTIKMGPTGELYSAFEPKFVGKLINPKVNDAALTFDVVSPLIGLNEDIVATKFYQANYPNMEEGKEGAPQPWIFGYVEGIVPTCIETLTHIYRIANHALEEVVAVYKDGVLLTLTTDYTLSGDNTEITLVADPGDSIITCKVKGAKCNQATNLIKYSEGYWNSVWDGLSNMSGVYYAKPLMTTGITDPYGGTRATEFADLDPWPIPADFVSGIKQTFANSGVTYSVGVTYTVSIWARCVTGTLTVYFGFDATHNSTFVLTTTWQRLTYTAAYVSGGTNIYIAERTQMEHTSWQIAFPQAVQDSALTRYTQTTNAVKTADAFSYNVADILAYFLSGNGPVSQAYTIDVEGINELLIRRYDLIGWQLDTVQKGSDFLSLLMRTSTFQLTPLLDGSVKPYIYKTTVDSDLTIRSEDIKSCVKYRDTTAVRKSVICKYGYDQSLDAWKQIVVTDDDVEIRYGTNDYLEIETANVLGLPAQDAATYLLEMYKQPPTKIDLKVGACAVSLVPGDQITLYKTVIRPGVGG